MLYVSKRSGNRLLITDTDDGVSEWISVHEARELVSKEGLEIKGVEYSTYRRAWDIYTVVPSEDSRLKAKFAVLVGADVDIRDGCLMSIPQFRPDTPGHTAVFQVSKYAHSIGPNVTRNLPQIAATSRLAPIHLTLVLDDGVKEVAPRAFRDEDIAVNLSFLLDITNYSRKEDIYKMLCRSRYSLGVISSQVVDSNSTIRDKYYSLAALYIPMSSYGVHLNSQFNEKYLLTPELYESASQMGYVAEHFDDYVTSMSSVTIELFLRNRVLPTVKDYIKQGIPVTRQLLSWLDCREYKTCVYEVYIFIKDYMSFGGTGTKVKFYRVLQYLRLCLNEPDPAIYSGYRKLQSSINQFIKQRMNYRG